MWPRLLALLSFFWAGPALAVDQGQWQLGAGAGFAVLRQGNNPTAGIGGRIEGRYGLRDDSAAWLAIGSTLHPRMAETVRASAVSAGFSLAYDVLRIVPLGEVGVTVSDLHGSATHGRYLGAEFAVGAEYLLDRHWSTAALARYQYLFVRLSGDAGDNPGVATIGLRISRSF